jgi:hypothetical protein
VQEGGKREKREIETTLVSFPGIDRQKKFRNDAAEKGGLEARVARRHIFKPKIPIWENFGGPCNGRCWYILWTFGLFYGHLIHFMAILYILW